MLISQKKRLSLLTSIVILIVINLFGNSLNSLIWAHFTLFINCICAQAIFLQLSSILDSPKNRVLRLVLSLLALLTGLITFIVILSSPMGPFNRIFFIIIQIAVTYAEAIQLKDEFKKQG